MKHLSILITALTITAPAFAEITNWWGLVSFRQRQETLKEYTDITQSGEPGTLRFTETNSRTRIGYQFGFKSKIRDNLMAGVTFRTGLGSVMWQDIDNQNALLPGLQEAYLDWKTPFADVQLGRFPQSGNALWDLYTAARLIDWRLYDPTDGVFNDRLSALNGVKVMVPLTNLIPMTLRAVYHTDYTGGFFKDWSSEAASDERDLDWNVYLAGLTAEYRGFTLEADIGLPYRVGDRYRPGRDSVYVDETLWGASLKKSLPELLKSEVQVGYAFNWRDSVFTAEFVDVIATAEAAGIKGTVRYQFNIQKHEFGAYRGHQATRTAYHFYLNYELWGLDVQPRVIWFVREIDSKRQRTLLRAEVTTTVRF